MPGRSWAPLVLVATLGGGCHTAVGNYFANRARDLGECFRVEVGGGVGIGGGAELGGIAHLGAGFGGRYKRHGLGWDYGYGYAFGAETEPGGDFAAEGYMPGPILWLEGHGRPWFAHTDLRFRRPAVATWRYKSGTLHGCPLVVPGLSSFGEKYWIWDRDEPDWVRLHAFDIGVSVYVGVVFVAAGFSPGEFVDFLLGWFGVDIAGDDRAWAPPATAAAEDPARER